jgi:hypothetical protein
MLVAGSTLPHFSVSLAMIIPKFPGEPTGNAGHRASGAFV